ncbi:putative late blight resistance protein homolog R1B-16 [Salvia splendens]|uniref:putative late blight resistance protein homolog R1B-16 n=1 Tax=Salvia splendens TaxID=180675 RepID=UPI001C255487|nr:putative late blight resistance protein homolog R1B-16 [Salvia splendens]
MHHRAGKTLLPDDEEEDNDDSSTTDFGGEKSAIFGLSDVYNELRDQLTVIEQLLRFKAVALVGMAGIGKTTLARKLFEDPLILDYFECRAWVKVGRKCRLEKILGHILAQLDSDRFEMCDKGEEILANSFRESLKGKRFLIVWDDVWETNLLVEIAKLCHYDKEGSRILLTSRLQHVGGRGVADLHMRLLNIEESWDLLREKVFGEESCSYQLEKVGRKVAENCEGLPLMIVKVAGFLSKYGVKTVQCWSEVMSRKNHKVYIDAYKETCEVVFPSYDNLQWHLKACFLYMGVFRQNYEIPQSKLIKMWIAEGFLESYNIQDLEHHSKACLNELVSNNLVMFTQQSSISVLEQTKGVKNCKLHSCVWYLCYREAMENKFFHVLRYLADARADGIERQRRLGIHNSVLLGIKDVHN